MRFLRESSIDFDERQTAVPTATASLAEGEKACQG